MAGRLGCTEEGVDTAVIVAIAASKLLSLFSRLRWGRGALRGSGCSVTINERRIDTLRLTCRFYADAHCACCEYEDRRRREGSANALWQGTT